MSRVDIPRQDPQAINWVTTFASVATANATLLNLTVGQTTTLTGLATAFSNAYDDSEEAKADAKGKVSTKDGMRQACLEQFRSTAKVINANPNISSALKANLGISVTPSVAGPVVSPIDLVAKGFANGANKLSWKRNGNASGTTFGIEAMYDGAGPWVFVAFTTKTRFNHSGQTPGRMVTYRTFAQRDDIKSDPSEWAVLYPISEVETFTLKQAA